MAPLFTDTASLRQYVLDVAGQESNPYSVADKVLAAVTTMDELDVIAATTFGAWVWQILKRPHMPSASTTTSAAPAFTEPAPKNNEVRGFSDGHGGVRGSSRQISFINEYPRWVKEMNRRVLVGADNRKHFGDCTTQDLAWMAEYRRNVANKNLAVAAQYVQLSEKMAETGATTVRELDRTIAEGILFVD